MSFELLEQQADVTGERITRAHVRAQASWAVGVHLFLSTA